MFRLAPDVELHGNLTLKAAGTALELHSKNFFHVRSDTNRSITGVLYDRTKVSLLDCFTSSSTRHGDASGEGVTHSASVFPHLVLFGDEHIGSDDKKVLGIHFVVDDATTLFYDLEAFSSVIDARPHIEQTIAINDPNASVETGRYPEIFYYMGKQDIFSVVTTLGKVSASHSPTIRLPGPSGFRLDNAIRLNIEFSEALSVSEATTRLVTVLRFMEIVVGRPQNLKEVLLRVDSEAEYPVFLDVYWSMPPGRDVSGREREPHPSSNLIDAVRSTDTFCKILQAWLTRQDDWRDARARFATSFGKQNYYDIDRLVGAANMFDILPDSAVPRVCPLDPSIERARDYCHEIFSKLPQTGERDSMLNAFGRLGKSSLKQKIRHRAKPIVSEASEAFPELDLVVNQAVDCRHYFVHGTKTRISYDDEFSSMGFFVDTLEFVFATSDLIEAGWDISSWVQCGSTLSHPFAQYRADYRENLRALKARLPRIKNN